VLVVDRLEDLQVREEGDARAAAVGLRALLQLALRNAALVRLRPLEAVAPHRQVEALRQRVDHGHADAVEAAGDLVAAAVAELAARVKDREHDLGRRPPLLLVHVDGDASPVVRDGDAVVRMDRDVDVRGLACQRLVDRVVHDLVDEVVEAPRAGRADVHAGTLPHGLEALEDRDVLGAVARRSVLRRGLLGQRVPSVSPGG
jgi:hypothetical protein